MRKSVLVLTLFAVMSIVRTLAWQQSTTPPMMPVPAAPRPLIVLRLRATEQEWIVANVAGAIAGIARAKESRSLDVTPSRAGETPSPTFRIAIETEPTSASVANHIWSPATYVSAAQQLLAPYADGSDPRETGADIAARSALTDLTTDVLLAENRRVSNLLQADRHSAAAHESAALLVGAFALRESVGMFNDVRHALSRMAAHLAIAEALRPAGPRTLDGMCARAVLAALAGLQRESLEIVTEIERRGTTETDRAWVRALRLRITGDWRNPPRPAGETRLEQLEYARALRSRRGIDAFLTYFETLPPDNSPDWHRIAFNNRSNVEAGHRFAEEGIGAELAEARTVWSRYHEGDISDEDLVAALNERPAAGPLRVVNGKEIVDVLDWGTWAAFQQRHLCHSLTSYSNYLWMLASRDRQDQLPATFEKPFGKLALYPVVLRWMAGNQATYEEAMNRARIVVNTAPELLTASAWNFLLEKPQFAGRVPLFPLEQSWFTPAVPSGTAFDLGSRSLRAGCPRPPTRAQSAQWAKDMPYDHWTQWADVYLAMDSGHPPVAAVRRAFGPLLEYDEGALFKAIEYLEMNLDKRIALGRTLCNVSPSRCNKLAELLLLDGRDDDSARAYERWIARSRDSVGVSNEMTWLTRYYLDHSNPGRAESIGDMAAKTGSARGMEAFAEVLDRLGRPDEAEIYYRRINDHYRDHSAPLGTFLMRKALRTGDSSLQAKAGELLRQEFPGGLQPVGMHALPVRPTSGVGFQSFGRRAAEAGLQPGDIIVGVDRWRVHNVRQYSIVTRLSHDPAMTLIIWRNGKYFEVTARVPQRWFGCTFHDFVGRS